MPKFPRAEVDEIIAKFRHHPEVLNVYVEGEFDQDVIDRFCNLTGIDVDVSIYAIDMIDISNEELARLGLPVKSQKSRVIALAQMISGTIALKPSNLVCLVDADCDRVLGLTRQLDHIRYTDYTCMEMHSLDKLVLGRFLKFACKLPDRCCTEFLEIAELILPCLFVCRSVVQSLSVGLSIPAIASGQTKKNDLRSFDCERYLSAFRLRCRPKAEAEEIDVEISRIRGLLSGDLRNRSHGHDFIELLFEYLWHKGNLKLHDKGEDVVRFGGRLVASHLDCMELATGGFFSDLLAAAQDKAHMVV